MQRPAEMILLEDPDGFPENVAAVVHLDDTATRVGPGKYRKRILRYGKWHHTAAPDGVLAVDVPYGQRLVRNFAEQVFDSVQVVKGHPKNDAERIANAAGAVVALDDAGGPDGPGVYATIAVPADVDAEIQAGKVVGCSAGIIPNYADHEIGGKGSVGPVLDHLALTPTPYIKGLGAFAPVHLADDTPSVLLSLSDADLKETVMDRAELITQAKTLGIDIEDLESKAGTVSTLEADLAAAKAAAAKEPTAEELTAAQTEAKDIAKGELAVALGEALTGAGLIELGEGQSHDLGSVIKAVGESLAAGKNANKALLLSEATNDVDAAIKDGKVMPSQRDALIKVRLSDEETYKALIPEQPLVNFSELGTTGADDDGIKLADGTKAEDEVKRLMELSDAMGLD